MNDLFVYRTFAAPVVDGSLPYRDVAFEYPPLAAPAIALPGLAGTGEDAFRWAFAVWTLLGAAAVVLLCGALARDTGGDGRRAMLAAATMPLSAAPFCGPTSTCSRSRSSSRPSCSSSTTGRGPASPCSASR